MQLDEIEVEPGAELLADAAEALARALALLVVDHLLEDGCPDCSEIVGCDGIWA